MRRFWPILLLALVPLIPLWRAVFMGEAIGAFDQVRQMAPWYADAPQRPWDVLQADSVLQFYPWRDLVFDSWSKGEIPAWNPYQLAGTPLLANSQSGALYPLHIVMGLLQVPTAPAMTLLAWFHLFWAGFGVYLLCLRLGGSQLGAVFGGVSFQLSAFMVAWTALPSVITTCAWIPWCLWAVYGAFGFGGPDSDQATKHRYAFRNVGLLALCTGMMLLAGHLQFAAYGLMATGMVVLWLLLPLAQMNGGERGQGVRGNRLFPALACLVAMALGGLLAAPQLLPVIRYSEHSHRQNTPTEEGYRAYVSLAIGLEAVAVLAPDLVGSPNRRSIVEIPPYPPLPTGDLSQYWPSLHRQGANFAETAIGVSPLTLACALLGLTLRPRRRDALVFVGAVALLLALGTPLNRLLYFGFPGWSSTGSPARVSILFVLSLCVLAGVGFSREALADRARVRRSLGMALGLATMLLLYVALVLPGVVQNRFVPDVDMAGYVRAATQTHLSLGLASILAVGLVVYASQRSERAGAWSVLGAAILLPSVQYAFSIVPTGKPLPRLDGPPAERIAVINDSWELVAAAPGNLPPNTASLSRIHDIGGYDSLLHKDSKSILDEINGRDSAPPANGNMMFVKPDASAAKLAEAGVSEVWSPEPLAGFGEPAGMVHGFGRYGLNGRRVSLEPKPAGAPFPGVVSEGYGRVEVQAHGPGRLILRDRNMDGWKVSIDGVPAPLEGPRWLEVDLPKAGKVSAVFSYEPPGLRVGLLLALASALCTAGLLVPWPKKKAPTLSSGG